MSTTRSAQRDARRVTDCTSRKRWPSHRWPSGR
jgi:hypothetical protein